VTHTPGPWHMVGSGWTRNLRGVDGQLVCVLSVREGRSKANALLIQAAPQLLEALETVVADPAISLGSLNEARAAIAKATGETQ
jgi:hypothetical protein